ncbi:MAG: XrtA/PEP-CTERM system histidine kinase PrsK [Pseudomonadota bacterium]
MLSNTATISYAIAASSFLVLCLLQLTRWRSRKHDKLLLVACALTSAWSMAIAQGAGQPSWSRLIDVLEVMRDASWSAVLLVLLGHFQGGKDGSTWWHNRSLLLIGGAYLALLATTAAGIWELEYVSGAGLMPSVTGRLGIAVLGMLLVEQLYRNRAPQERWSVKFFCLGIGGMFVYDFYLFSDTMLFRVVNPDIWAARGLVNALTVPLIAISAARSVSWSSGVSVSRRVLFHSATLLGSAFYLLAMGSAGYYLRYFGGRWGSVMQVGFLFGALVLLAGILFSGTFRSWLKVFISKHFYSYNYDYREEWLKFTRTLSEDGPNLGDRTLQAVAELVESPGGALWIRRDSGLFEPAAHWHTVLSNDSEPEQSAFCQFLGSKQWVIDLPEFDAHPELYEALHLPEWVRQFPRARLVVPLIMQGKLFGFMLLQQPRSAIKLNWEVIDLLKIAGSQAASFLAQQEAANALMTARQFESFNRMSTFVVHDLKNLVSQLSLLIPNAEKHRNNPEFQRDMLDTVTLSVQKMRLMLQKLSRSDSSERPLALQIDKVLRQAVSQKAAFEPKPILHIDLDGTGLSVLADADRLERVVGHLIQNAIEATAKEGRVAIHLGRQGQQVVIEISDTGSGMSADFIQERLFKPFESTKSAGMGIGAFESREYIQELGGRLEVVSDPAQGTTFTIRLPLHMPEQHIAVQAA